MSPTGPWKDVSQYQDAEASPGFLLWRTHMIWKRKIEASLTSHDLTHIQFVLLAGLGYLTKHGEAVAQNQLAHFTHCDVTMTSQVLRSLEKKGFIARTHKADDDRAKYPHLTAEGFKKIKAAMQTVESTDKAFFNKLKEKQTDFKDGLKRLLMTPL